MYIFANYKAYLDFDETNILVNQLLHETLFINSDHTIAVFPSMLAFSEVQKALNNTSISIGVQHVGWTPKGAYTGSVSALQAKEAGAQYTLVGHSERRHVFGESNEDVAKRFAAAMDAGLIPVLCIGETKEDLDNDKREYRLKKQLYSVLESTLYTKEFVVAYEPVWAIAGSGSGEACQPEVAESVHYLIKSELTALGYKDTPVIYGGSVNNENVVSYTSLPSVDGVLVGSASTTIDRFIPILEALK